MQNDHQDYKYCINLSIDNAKQRIKLLKKMDQRAILEEYKEWMIEDFNYQTVLLLREDPII